MTSSPSSDDDRAQLQETLDWLEERLRHNHFDEVDRWLDDADFDRLAPVTTIGILSLTFWGKGVLKRRGAFLERAEIALRSQLKDDARVERLLSTRR